MSSDAALWIRLFNSAEAGLTPAAAAYLLALRFPPDDVKRMRVLSAKARDGILTRVERADMDTYERVGHALSIMKSKARRVLTRARTAP